MSEKFSLNLNISNGKAIIDLKGMMDEDMDLSKAAQVNELGFVFNFDGVTGINSCGIRDWIEFLNKLSDADTITYENCPQVIIEQMNMVKGFIPDKASIQSFYAPFFCESCDHEEKVLLRTEEIVNGEPPKDLACSKCQAKPLEFDAIPNQYFHFIK